MFVCKDICICDCDTPQKHDIEFSDDLLEYMGVTDEYIGFLYDKYLEYKAKEDSMYTLIGVCLQNINKNANNKKKLKETSSLCETYWWMSYSWLFDVPELQQYKIYPEVRWFDASWKNQNRLGDLMRYLDTDLSDFRKNFEFSDKELRVMGIKRGYIEYFFNMLTGAADNKSEFRQKLKNEPNNRDFQKQFDFWRKREALICYILDEFKNKVNKVSEMKHNSKKHIYDWMVSNRDFWNMVELRDFKLYPKRYPYKELRL